jgi:hypothetical protein
MHIYAFGSVCRGDLSPGSDVDLLAIAETLDPRFDPEIYSIYSYKRICELWEEGNPFAWHLWLESKLLYSPDGNDYLRALGSPRPYQNCFRDCEKFAELFRDGVNSILATRASTVFDLSTIFLSIRNFASCFSLGVTTKPDFSRNAALHLGKHSLRLSAHSYQVLERARILCTRGNGTLILEDEIESTIERLDEVRKWMNSLLAEVKTHARV